MYQQQPQQFQQFQQPQGQQQFQQRPNPQALQAQMLLQQLMQGAQQGQQGGQGSPQNQNTGLNKQPTTQKNMLGMSSLTDEASARSQAATANANKSFSTPGYGF